MTHPATLPWVQEEEEKDSNWVVMGAEGVVENERECEKEKKKKKRNGWGGVREVLRAGALKILFLIAFAIKSLHRHCS